MPRQNASRPDGRRSQLAYVGLLGPVSLCFALSGCGGSNGDSSRCVVSLSYQSQQVQSDKVKIHYSGPLNSPCTALISEGQGTLSVQLNVSGRRDEALYLSRLSSGLRGFELGQSYSMARGTLVSEFIGSESLNEDWALPWKDTPATMTLEMVAITSETYTTNSLPTFVSVTLNQ